MRAARKPVVGCARVAKFIASLASHFWTGVTLTWIDANGLASVLMARDSAVVAFATVSASAEGIDQLLWMMRPSKLAAVSRALPVTREP